MFGWSMVVFQWQWHPMRYELCVGVTYITVAYILKISLRIGAPFLRSVFKMRKRGWVNSKIVNGYYLPSFVNEISINAGLNFNLFLAPAFLTYSLFFIRIAALEFLDFSSFPPIVIFENFSNIPYSRGAASVDEIFASVLFGLPRFLTSAQITFYLT